MPREDTLRAGLASLGLPSNGAFFDGLARYVAEIERLNPSLGLVGASGDELIIKHILDSLAPVSFLRSLIAGKAHPGIADLGTGAGLPGIPLALAFPDAEIALIDRMTRRTDFLREMVEGLKIYNATVIETQVEHAR